jgi:hypothetical protein
MVPHARKAQGTAPILRRVPRRLPGACAGLLGATIDEPVLHVCGGCARLYPYRRRLRSERQDAGSRSGVRPISCATRASPTPRLPRDPRRPAVQRAEAAHYKPGADHYPPPALIVRNAIDALEPGQRVGIIHYQLPQPPANARFVAAVGVLCGFNNRIRVYSVFEKTKGARR